MRAPRLRAPSKFADRSARILFESLVTFLALACAAGIWRVAAVLYVHVPLDPNEGWNAYHTAAAMAGHGPYPAVGGFMTNNYPPLSFYLVGVLGMVTGDAIVAGRVVSLFSFLTVAGGIMALARRFGCGRIEALLAALLFAGFLLLNSDYVGMDDPQLLGHALQISALLLLLPGPGSLSRELGSAALFVAALFVKHNLVVLPLAGIVWLLFYDWRSALRLTGLMLVLGLAGLATLRLAFGVDLLSRLNAPRSYSLALLMENSRDWLVPAAIPVTATLAAAASRERFALFCAVYALIGIVIGAVFLGGAGVDVNVMFDADIAISLGAGIAVSRAGVLSGANVFARPVLAATLIVPLATGLARSFDPGWLGRDFWLNPMREETTLAASDIAYLRAHDGPAFCEMLSLCYWAGKPAAVDVFNLDQQFVTGARDQGPFIRLLNVRAFAVIQLDSLSPFPFPTEVQAALRRNYRVDRQTDDGAFLVPRA